MRALSIASTGMLAQQTNVEVIANNLANMNTTGFKEQRVEFQDLLYQNIQAAGSATSDTGTLLPQQAWLHSMATPRWSSLRITPRCSQCSKNTGRTLQHNGFEPPTNSCAPARLDSGRWCFGDLCEVCVLVAAVSAPRVAFGTDP